MQLVVLKNGKIGLVVPKVLSISFHFKRWGKIEEPEIVFNEYSRYISALARGSNPV